MYKIINLIKRLIPIRIKKFIISQLDKRSWPNLNKYQFVFNLNRTIRGQQLVNNDTGWIFASSKNSYFTYHLRPKYASDVKTQNTEVISEQKMAIIIQGPIVYDENFTIESIKLYRKLHPNSVVILSTWHSEDEKIVLSAKNLGAQIILNHKPEKYAYGNQSSSSSYNLNLQLITTKNALLLAKEQGCQFSLKTRADMRFYKPNLFSYFSAMLNAFPIRPSDEQQQRLIVSSIATCKYRIYGITDVMMFGTTNDMLNYWSADFYEDGILPYVDNRKQIPPIINKTPVSSEIYLTIKYLEYLNVKPLWTLKHWWSICRDYFCVVDSYALDLYWYKYERNVEYRFTRSYPN